METTKHLNVHVSIHKQQKIIHVHIATNHRWEDHYTTRRQWFVWPHVFLSNKGEFSCAPHQQKYSKDNKEVHPSFQQLLQHVGSNTTGSPSLALLARLCWSCAELRGLGKKVPKRLSVWLFVLHLKLHYICLNLEGGKVQVWTSKLGWVGKFCF